MRDRSAVTALFASVAAERRDVVARAVAAAVKRAGDIAAACVALVFLAPLMMVIAVVVRLGNRAPVLYAHRRIGRNGRGFGCLKFRTMHPDGDRRLAARLASDPALAAEWSRTRKLARDPRVSTVGRLLRRTSLDELPQLFNVLRGDMSMVGPRPVTSEELPRYGSSARAYLAVRPGLTGLWQVSGRNDLSYGERVRLDARYVRERTLLGDLAILLRTPVVMLLRRGAR